MFLIWILGAAPGRPLSWRKFTPGSLPTSAPVAVTDFACANSCAPTEEIAPVTEAFFWASPKPVTTTSSSNILFSFSVTTILFLPDTGTVWVIYPIKEIVSTSLERTDSLKLPSTSVIVPFLLFWATTLAPITASPWSSTTVPLIFILFCAATWTKLRRTISESISFLRFNSGKRYR